MGKDIFIIRSYKAKDGTDKADWIRAGVAFDCKDSSINFELYTMPGVKFQIRERNGASPIPPPINTRFFPFRASREKLFP